MFAATPSWGDAGEREHFIQFYESDAFLLISVGAFIGAGLLDGSANVVIATPAHLQALEPQWEARGIDLEAARADGRYIPLDAAETLACFMRQGWPRSHLFNELIGGILADAAARHGQVRAFGEMVSLLWAEGNETGAIRLEELWDKLGEDHAFSLFAPIPCKASPTAPTISASCRSAAVTRA